MVRYLILGVVQGLTEFLPVSSSGHLVLAERLLGLDPPGVLLEAFLHLGTLAAVILLLRADLAELFRALSLRGTLERRKEIGFLVAPVGWAWRTVISEHPALHYLFLSDYNHPSLRGSYLTACVLYVSVFKESVVGNGYHGGVPEEEAEYFQRVASRTVLDNLQLWNIPATAR